MITITTEQMQAICPFGKARVAQYVPHLNKWMDQFGIDTPRRAAAFLAQLAHESGEFRYTKELGGEKYLNDHYDTRTDLGNTAARDGDGAKWAGRGLIQITGATNYHLCGKGLGLDLKAQPELLEQPEWAVASACWYWSSLRGLNRFADQGAFAVITKKINGGMNGYSERLMYWERAKKAIGNDAAAPSL